MNAIRWWRARPRQLRGAAWGALGVMNARWPRRFNRLLHVPSFFWSWFVTEAAFPFLLLHMKRSLQGRRSGRGTPAEALATDVLDAVAVAGYVSFIVEGRRTDDEFAAVLTPWIGEADIAARPHSARIGQWLPFVMGGRNRVRTTRNVVFTPEGAARRMRLDIYESVRQWEPGDELRPAIVQIHGGAWVIGDKREQGIPLLNHLAHNGWVGFNVNYALSPRTRAPHALIDCKAAIAWIREHAEEYGVDPDMICVTGGSAGGHLAALVALTGNDPALQPGFEEADTTVAAAVPFYGVYDLVDEEQLMIKGFRRALEPVLFAARYRDDPAPFEAYSPYYRIHAGAPPMMVVHGARDALVPVESARRFVAKLHDVSEHAVLYAELQGAQHAFEVFPSPRTVRAVEYTERFLDGVRRGVIK